MLVDYWNWAGRNAFVHLLLELLCWKCRNKGLPGCHKIDPVPELCYNLPKPMVVGKDVLQDIEKIRMDFVLSLKKTNKKTPPPNLVSCRMALNLRFIQDSEDLQVAWSYFKSVEKSALYCEHSSVPSSISLFQIKQQKSRTAACVTFYESQEANTCFASGARLVSLCKLMVEARSEGSIVDTDS